MEEEEVRVLDVPEVLEVMGISFQLVLPLMMPATMQSPPVMQLTCIETLQELATISRILSTARLILV